MIKKVGKYFYRKLKKIRRKFIENKKIAKVAKDLDISKNELKNRIVSAKKQFDISCSQYFEYKCYDLNKKELKELKDELKKKKEKREKDNLWYINVVMEKTGWSRDEAIENLNIAKKRGYTYRKFITCGLYHLTKDEIKHFKPYSKFKKTGRENKKLKEDASEIKIAKNSKTIVMEEKKWNEAKYKLEFLKASNICGCSHAEFQRYKIYDMKPSLMKKLITFEVHLKLQIRYCDFGKNVDYFENKGLFNETFKKYVTRKWFLNENLSYEDFLKNIEGLNQIIYKPIDSLCGHGIEKFYVNNGKNEEVYEKIKEGNAIIEECLSQKEEISEFWPKTINTIRIMTLCKDGKVNILNGLMRFGVGENVDNFAAGGIGAAIDIKHGKLATDGVSKKAEIFKCHPNSSKKFKGFEIPCWDKIVETLEDAATIVKEMPYIGWDVCVKENGDIELVEGNHNQDAMMLQYPYAIIEKKGIRDSVEEYLWFDEESKTI